MTRAKITYGRRQTRFIPVVKKKRAFAEGRPQGTNKKYPFEQTRLGFLLKYEMPVVYDIVMDKCKSQLFPHPSPQVIEFVSRASKDPTYKKPKFRRCMDEYIATGICCKRPKILTPKLRVYYQSIRKKKMDEFIARNRRKIERMKRELFNNGFNVNSQGKENQ